MCGGAGHACLGNARRNGTGRAHAAEQVFAGQTFCRRLHWPRTCGGAGFCGAGVLQTTALAAHMRWRRFCGADVLQTAALAAYMRRRRFLRGRRFADGCTGRAHAVEQVFAGQAYCRRLHWPRTCGGAGSERDARPGDAGNAPRTAAWPLRRKPAASIRAGNAPRAASADESAARRLQIPAHSGATRRKCPQKSPPHARMRGRSSWPASRRRAQAYLGQ